MKKLVIVFLLAISGTLSNAQTIDFGLKAGLNLTGENHANTYDLDQGLLAGINIGGIADVNYKNFVIQPGLFFTTKGETGKVTLVTTTYYDTGDNSRTESFKSHLYYIEVPVNFLYNTTPVKGTGVHFGGGPYFAYGVAETDIDSYETSAEHTFNYHRPDVGLGAIFGITLFYHFLIDAGFEYGLLNIDEQGGTTHNMVISISGGYLFK